MSGFTEDEGETRFRRGKFLFFSDFDSGNLGRIEWAEGTEWEEDEIPPVKEEVEEEAEEEVRKKKKVEASSSPPPSRPKTRRRRVEKKVLLPKLEGDFNCWTRPDCFGTPFENGNRTWFYFGMKVVGESEDSSGSDDWNLRFTFKNLNKQTKLFSQGFAPVYKVLDEEKGEEDWTFPGEAWERLSNVTYKTMDNQFYMNFIFSLEKEKRNKTIYFAFTYPYSFTELERRLDRLERQYGKDHTPSGIYFHRGVGTYSYENRPIYVLTISGMNGLLEDGKEPVPMVGSSTRPKKFGNKKYIFLSARVHPGETQSSYILDGFLRMLLRENDARSVVLRTKYVFKIIPMLNPDGVFRGHYRTDARGINLNRVYGNPDPTLHPSIHYAKKFILYAHFGKVSDPRKADSMGSSDTMTKLEAFSCVRPSPSYVSSKSDFSSSWYEMTETSRCSEGDESIADFSFNNTTPSSIAKTLPVEEETSFFLTPTTSSAPNARTSFSEAFRKTMDEDFSRKIEGGLEGPEKNLFLYMDIHGHASKRGVFMYGNHFMDLDTKIDSMLLPKLVSINSPNFDFPACNFTEKNMYLKDRHTGAGREGCGRVSVFKSTGLVYSYTLEANFNTGREVNEVPGRSLSNVTIRTCSPPPFYDRPPKFTPEIYENAGKAVAVSLLDLTDSNPWSRVPYSSCKSLKGVKESIRRFIKTSEEHARKSSSVASGGTSSPGRMLRRRSAQAVPKKSFSDTKSPESKVAKKGDKPLLSAPSSSGVSLFRPTSPTRPSSARTTRNKINNKKSLIPPVLVESPPIINSAVLGGVGAPIRKKKKIQKRRKAS